MATKKEPQELKEIEGLLSLVRPSDFCPHPRLNRQNLKKLTHLDVIKQTTNKHRTTLRVTMRFNFVRCACRDKITVQMKAAPTTGDWAWLGPNHHDKGNFP